MSTKRSAITFSVERKSGKWTSIAREIFKEQFAELEMDGHFKVQVKREGGYKLKTRYKYYFDSLLNSIFDYGQKRYLIIDRNNIRRPPKSTQELHECIKHEFNPVTIVNQATGEVTRTASSTTNLSDAKFMGEFLEEITMTFMQDYPDIEIEDYDTWKERKKEEHETIKQ